MNHQIETTIREVTVACLDNRINFPQAVLALLELGVSRYRVDYERNEKVVYLRSGESFVEIIDLPKNPIGPEFQSNEIRAAVRSSQNEGQTFRTFIDRTKRAGCVGYTAYLDGKKVVYSGRLGEEYVEPFPN